MEHLYEKLAENAAKDIYPYHMPGHKRRAWGMLPEALYNMDITEIDGFDNLHQPEGILLDLQRKAACLYGADESFYLINGSTGGILAAVSCALPAGGHILMARNCHKSAYHAAYLRNLKLSYLSPPFLEEYGVCDALEPEQVQSALDREPDIGAVLIVSPTYEGRISDIRAISEIAHRRGIPLIVDEAHGAHLGLPGSLGQNSCQLGADLVIHSVHKTLPSLTQTALLHRNGALIDGEKLKRFLHIYQSSSPSYLLMMGIDNALRYMETDGERAFGQFRALYENMMERLAGCRHLKFLTGDFSRQDMGKLLVSVRNTNLTGRQLYDILLKTYRLQTEMASESYVLAMFTLNDGKEAYDRMAEALLEVDRDLGDTGDRVCERAGKAVSGACGRVGKAASGSDEGAGKTVSGACEGAGMAVCSAYEGAEKAVSGANEQPDGSEDEAAKALPLTAAWDAPTETVTLEDSVGRYVGEFVNLYPPGIPLLVPGEKMTESLCRKISEDVKQNLSVQGIAVREGVGGLEKRIEIKVLREKRVFSVEKG